MKIRTGFVSNSSSSSFILMVGKNTYEKVLDNLNGLAKDMLKWIVRPAKIDNHELIVIEGGDGEWGSTFDGYKPGDGGTGYKKGTDKEAEEDLYETWIEIKDKLQAGGQGTYFYSHQSF